jgi:hypothetical protein
MHDAIARTQTFMTDFGKTDHCMKRGIAVTCYTHAASGICACEVCEAFALLDTEGFIALPGMESSIQLMPVKAGGGGGTCGGIMYSCW